jgi:hypothetical protein
MCESFFATLECELLDRRRFQTQIEARMAIFEFIVRWYNPHRRHSALDYLSPIDYERAYGAQLSFRAATNSRLKTPRRRRPRRRKKQKTDRAFISIKKIGESLDQSPSPTTPSNESG